MSEKELIEGCLNHESAWQRTLYEFYFSKMMHICIRYAKNKVDAKNILLDGFKNVFNDFRNYTAENTKIKNSFSSASLEEWIKKKIIASAIRHMHDNQKEHFVSSTVSTRDFDRQNLKELSDEQLIKSSDKQAILNALQQLTPSYRVVYNLHEIDGYSHQEISKLLDVSEYISKDSLLKAKYNLRKNLTQIIPK